MNMDLNILTDTELESINGGSSNGIWGLVISRLAVKMRQSIVHTLGLVQ